MRNTMGTVMPAELGARLREFRKRAGLSAEQAGLEIGLSARVIGDFERGYRVPRLGYLRVLAALYGARVADLIGVEITETTGPQPEYEHAEHIRSAIDNFPPLGPGQRDQLAVLLRPPATREATPA